MDWIASSFDAAAAIADHGARVEAYTAVCDKVVASGDASSIEETFSHLTDRDVPLVVSRQSAAHFAKALCESPLASLDPENFIRVAEHCVSRIRAQASTCDDAEYTLREGLFAALSNLERYKEAANCLAAFSLDGTFCGRPFTETEKADVYVRIAEAFLAEDESDAAENFLKKASTEMHSVDDPVLDLRYRTTSARVLDSNRKFLDASVRFYYLSQTSQVQVDEGDLLELLGKAITCAILGKAGPQRSRILGMLFKDERLPSLERHPDFVTHRQVLTKMYLEQILRRPEMEVFEQGLAEHQKAITSDGLTISARAIIEHNVVAASRIYNNVRLVELGTFLQISPQQAEQVAARMISEGRLKARIDQIDGVLQYESSSGNLQQWDEQISGTCLALNRVCHAIEISNQR